MKKLSIFLELEPTRTNGNDVHNDRGTADNGHGQANRSPDASESDGLLRQVNVSNGESVHSAPAADARGHPGRTHTPPEISSVCRIKKELNEVVFWRVRLWMVFVFIFLLMAAVIMISLAVCSVIHEDADDKFDPSSFTIPRCFNGSFRLPARVFTEELLTISSNESRALAADLRQKVADLYRSSPALGRFFSQAEIYSLRNGSVIAEYRLTFLMPAEQQDQLRNFTLSREVVYNVFRQSLYDQEDDESGPMYIDPGSLILL